MPETQERRRGSRARLEVVGGASRAYLNGKSSVPKSPEPVAVDETESFVRLRRRMWGGFGVLAVLLVAYFISVVVRGGSGWLWLDGWGVTGFEFVASVMCIYKGFAQRNNRAVPLILGFALLSWSIGDFVLTAESLGGATPSNPSYADIAYLLFYPIAYVGTVLLLQKALGRLARPNWLDGVVAGLGAAALCGAFAFHSIEHAVGLSALGTAVNLAYPVGDFLLLILVIGGTVLLSARGSAQWYLLGIGLSVIVIGDTFNLFQSSGLAIALWQRLQRHRLAHRDPRHLVFGMGAASTPGPAASPARLGLLPAGPRVSVRTLHPRLRNPSHAEPRVAVVGGRYLAGGRRTTRPLRAEPCEY